jgi:intracellular multiplication protein IcmD
MKFKRMMKWSMYILGLALCLFSMDVFAAGGTTDAGIAGIANNIAGTFASLAKLITAVSYVAGMGFAMAAILKFKAHKDAPTQIPIGTPIALLFVAAALLFLPSLFTIAGQTVFGTSGATGGISGVTSFST